MSNPQQLKKTLTVTQATGLGITIVIGSGLLLLPGLAYQQSGAASLYAWILCALMVIPLLVIFSALGARFPTAGGVAGFMQNAFSRHFAGATELMLIGTFGLGIPAIALTGSYYLNILLPAAWQSESTTLISSLLLIATAYWVNNFGAKISGNIQRALAIFLILALLLIPLLALTFSERSLGSGITAPLLVEVGEVLPLLGMVFFAFTGWEMLSFTIEEYKNPKRDYPISVALSFLIVVFLYLFLVIALQTLIPVDHPLLNTAPLSALAQHTFGIIAGQLVAVLSFVIILANLIGAVWAASRLVFSSAREGLLPHFIARLNHNTHPRVALATACLFFAVILTANHFKLLTVTDLLRLAGQNFFILYGMAVLAYIKTAATNSATLLGAFSLLIVLAAMGTFGIELLYPAGLLAAGYATSKYRSVSQS